jgi:Flp pilus assembly protein TadD
MPKPECAEAHNNLGNALRDLGRPGEAAAEYLEAVRLRTNIPEVHLSLGLSLKEQGQYAEAVAALRRGHELGSRRRLAIPLQGVA